MDMQHDVILRRMKLLLDSFLHENFASTDNVYFEKLITQLSAKENIFVLQAPFTFDFVDKCITAIEEDFSKINPQVISFMFNLCSLLGRNEWNLLEIKDRKIMDRIRTIIERDGEKFNPSMKLGCMRLLSMVCSYSMGLAFIGRSRGWWYLTDYCNTGHTLYVVREAQKLLYKLLYNFSVKARDEHVVLDILNEILKPINENVYDERSDQITIFVDDCQLQHKLSNTLDLISYIFQQTLESEEKTNLANLCNKHHRLERAIWKLTESTQNEYFLEKILTALTSYNFATLVYEKWESGEIAPENFNQFGINFFNTMKFCIMRKDCVNFLKLAELNHILWKKLGKRAPREVLIENERVRFENQLITFHLLPLLFVLKSREFRKMELFDQYLMKLFSISCEHTLRICYSFRDILCLVQSNTGSRSLLADLAYKSIHSILSILNKLEFDHGVLVFQAIIYALKDYILNSKIDDNGTDTEKTCVSSKSVLIMERPDVMYTALIGLQNIIKQFNLTWKESIETICVMNFMLVILENDSLPPRVAVQALKLGQLSIEHYLSPNMALLVNNLKGSALECMGPIIVQRLHDPTWEVRDSTLELVNSIVTISRIKFPPFQQFIASHKIAPIVVQSAKNDSEAYVRASAFKCLSQMVGINVLWDNDLGQLDLIEHLFFVLYNESEGIVRKEAVITLLRIYDNRRIPNEYKDMLYSIYAHCVVADLYWEVKVNALHFWELEIQKQFTNQGMIDGTFPTVTFSKEHKKIVTLTEKEIKIRIMKVFNELSQLGCFGVILQCLNDDCDLEVIKMAVCMVNRLFEQLKKYDYESIIAAMEVDNNNHSNNEPTRNEPTKEPTTPQSLGHNKNLDSDSIIESILSSQDINLLASNYDQKLQLNGDANNSKVDEHFYKKFSSIDAKEFLAGIKRIDLEKLLLNQKEWLLNGESLLSLLDDIILTLKPIDESIFADCY